MTNNTRPSSAASSSSSSASAASLTPPPAPRLPPHTATPLPASSDPVASQPQHSQNYHMNPLDMESLFFRLHSKLVYSTKRYVPGPVLWFTETILLTQAVGLLMTLVWFHYTYVTMADTSCFTLALREEIVRLEPSLDALDMLKIRVAGIWSRLEEEDTKVNPQVLSTAGFTLANQVISVWLNDPIYLYAKERGFLMLEETTRARHGVKTVEVNFDVSDKCFSGASSASSTFPVPNSGFSFSWSSLGSWERYIIDNFVGYDTIILNALGSIFSGRGYVYSLHSRELLNVGNTNAGSGGQARSDNTPSIAFKLTAVVTTLFLFFITTTLVHHTLRETQERMLKFTYDLQVYVRQRSWYGNLVLNHVVGSLVFVPIMVGMLFFLFEFFNDQLLTFMVLAIVWICELYSVVTLRTAHNVRVFPRLFFLYFCSFHLYFFTYPSGFSYMALTVTVMFLQHAMLSFFVRYEMPALMSGRISAFRMRDVVTDLMPEEVQAGGASLAVRALVGARVVMQDTSSSSSSSSSSSLSTAPGTTTPMLVIPAPSMFSTSPAGVEGRGGSSLSSSTFTAGAVAQNTTSIGGTSSAIMTAGGSPSFWSALDTSTSSNVITNSKNGVPSRDPTPQPSSRHATTTAVVLTSTTLEAVTEEGEGFIARPARKKRTTIHAEPDISSTSTNNRPGDRSPTSPTETGSLLSSASTHVNKSPNRQHLQVHTWVDTAEDDSSSAGWEIGDGES